MKRALAGLLVLAAQFFCEGQALGATTDEIFAVYARGDYEQAARLGEAARTAPGLAIAARAFGQVWLAVAQGYQARITGAVKARIKNSPAQSKAALEAAVADDPKNAYAVSALGGWHIEVVRGGGATLARMFYGARETTALSLFDRSVRLAPDNVAVRYQIGLSLAGFDADKYRARIAAEFKAALAAAPDTAYEKKIQARAGELLGLLNQNEAFQLRVRKYQGFPD
jgi:hypothetical protein